MEIDVRAPGGPGAGDAVPATPFLHDWLAFHARRSPTAPAVADRGSRLTYAQLADRVGALADLLGASGIGPGSRVLLALPNRPATVVAGLAVNALGAISVEVSRTWSAEILGDIVTRSGVRQAFIAARDLRTWATALSGQSLDRVWVVGAEASPGSSAVALGGIPVRLVGEDGEVVAAAAARAPAPTAAPRPELSPPELSPDAPALVLYTSGSTGRPQGVIQTFRNIDANTRSIVEYLGLTAADRALIALPLSYCYGRSVLQTHLFAGGSVFLDDRMAFPRSVLESLASEACTGFAGVPLTFELIRRQVDVSTIRLANLRYVTQAGGAMAPDTIAWAREAFRPAELFVMYGQTEATARLSYLPPARAVDKAGSIGIPIPGVELRVVDDGGQEVPIGEVGVLVAKGPNVTPGYLDEPAETAAILRDGWLWTGDLARRDADGFLYHVGRAKEVLKVAGHRVSPAEIEQVLAGHPGVVDAAVIGVKDELLGEVPRAVIVPRPERTPNEVELSRFCRERLPPFQVPATFVFVRSLPRNASGKLLRAEITARYGSG